MTDLSSESIQRIADARRDAETELNKALSGVRVSDDVAPYLSAFTSFASALFDAEAGELLAVGEDAGRFEAALQDELAPRLIEGILPDRSLSRVGAGRTDELKQHSVRHDLETDLLWEPGLDEMRRPAPELIQGVYAQHGDWEHFMPKGIRFRLRFQQENATVREALTQALQRRAFYWLGQHSIRARRTMQGARAGTPQDTPDHAPNLPLPNRASWLATRLHERAWNKHDVERNNGPDHKTVQKILSGRHVREDVLKKLAAALSAAPSWLKLPRVNLPDIPTD